MLGWIDSEMCVVICMCILKVRLHTLLTEAIFLLLIQVAKGVHEANAHCTCVSPSYNEYSY